MKISVEELKALPQKRLTFHYNETLAGLSAVKPVVGELTAVVSASGMKLTGTVKTLLKLNCDRCLNPYFQSLTVDVDERFVPTYEFEAPKERELLKSDFVEPLPDNGLLDISDIVYQAVTLATPSYALCGEECPGPPASAVSAGAKGRGEARASEAKKDSAGSQAPQAPIDPRWKNLKSLFPKEES